jgi:hypothetical protein
MKTTVYTCALALGMTSMFGCAAADVPEQQADPGAGQSTPADDQLCVPGHQTACACPGETQGLQICDAEGAAFGACECATPEPPEPGPNDACGDNFCASDESCMTCETDCGVCKPCDIAPSCNDADVPPGDLTHNTDFDVPKMDYISPDMLAERLAERLAKADDAMRTVVAALDSVQLRDEHPFVTKLRGVFADHPEARASLLRSFDKVGLSAPSAYRAYYPELRIEPINYTPMTEEFGGTIECGDPLLRLAVSAVTVHEEDDDWANDKVYCVIQAEANNGAEVRVTPQTPALDEGETHQFSLESGVFWGQAGPTTPGGSLLITYDCIEADTTDGYQNMINAIGKAASQVGDNVEGDNGWIFKTAGNIAPIVASGLALDTDDHLFNAQQTIDMDKHLEMTNGTFWTVRRAGKHLWSEWDWELTVKAWGCAEFGTL